MTVQFLDSIFAATFLKASEHNVTAKPLVFGNEVPADDAEDSNGTEDDGGLW